MLADLVYLATLIASFTLGALWAGPRLYHERLRRYIARHPGRPPVTGDELAERLDEWHP